MRLITTVMRLQIYIEMTKVGSNYDCLAVILIDFVLETDENYYPQVSLKECKCKEKGKR